MRLLLIDDDEVLMETLANRLIKQRYAVDIANTGELAQEFLALFTYDLIVLDMVLPDVEGITFCRSCRTRDVICPILMLTAKDNSQDKVQALDAGADDYVVKPFDFEELCARIRALLRRDSQGAIASLQWGDLKIYPETFEVFFGIHQLRTTPKEYALLELFLRHPNRVFSIDSIIDNLWSFEDPPSSDAVRTHVKGVRQKLKAGGAPKDFIETVYGLGYRLRALLPEVAVVEETPMPTQLTIAAAVAQAWESHQGTMQERLHVLEAAAAALDVGQLSPDLQEVGCSHAHKLAGSLGCFGFAEGSQLARQLERLLEQALDSQEGPQMMDLVQRLRTTLAEGGSNHAIATALSSAPHILIGGANPFFSQALIEEGLASGIRTVAVPKLGQIRAVLNGHGQPPDGLLLWIKAATFNESLDLLDEPALHPAKPPIIVLTDIQGFPQRLQLVQHGVDRILSPSTPHQQIINDLKQLLQADKAAFKVMAVDDDGQVLTFVKTILAPWGFQLTTLEDPTQLLQTLKAVQPHLLILDVEMPEINGFDLCQVLRADDQWRQLPILFLTGHEDTLTQQKAFQAGADDFISKSVMATDLPIRILSRLKRSQ